MSIITGSSECAGITLHLGTTEREELIPLILEVASTIVVIEDGDQWEEWGEPLANDDEVHHVQVTGLLPEQALTLTGLVAQHLTFMVRHHQLGTLAVVTSTQDFSDVLLTVNILP